MSENFGHPVTHVQKLQVITGHAHNGFLSLTAPLGKIFYFLSSLQRVASLGCFENTDFTPLGLIDNLESKAVKDINKNQLNTLLGCRTETINGQIIVWVWYVSSRLAKKKTLGRQDRGDRRYLVPRPANAIFNISKRLLNRNNSCVELLKWTGK